MGGCVYLWSTDIGLLIIKGGQAARGSSGVS